MPIYAGGATVNTTFISDGTQQQMVNALEDALNAAGWTTLSGHHTATVVVKSAVTPRSHYLAVRMKAPGGSTACITLEIMDEGATVVGQACFWKPTTGVTYRIVANKYRGICMVPGSAAQRYFAMFECPFIPTDSMAEVTAPGAFGYMAGDSYQDAAGNTCWTFRKGLTCNQFARTSVLMNNMAFNMSLDNSGGSRGAPCLAVVRVSFNVTGYWTPKWGDGSQFVIDPFLFWSMVGTNDEAGNACRGMSWDALVLNNPSWGADSVFDYDGKKWMVITMSPQTNIEGAYAVLIPSE
jgi:hypothetical protein